MRYELPPNYAAMKRTLVRSHNRRVILLMLVVFSALIGGVLLSRDYQPTLYAGFGGAIAIEVVGMIFLIRLAAKQGVALGYVCPLCKGSLYDGKSNRLVHKGECPRCKQFIADKLG